MRLRRNFWNSNCDGEKLPPKPPKNYVVIALPPYTLIIGRQVESLAEIEKRKAMDNEGGIQEKLHTAVTKGTHLYKQKKMLGRCRLAKV